MNRAKQRAVSPPRSAWYGPPGPPSHLKTLVDVTRWRAERQSDELIFTFLADGENESGHLTFRTLDERARNIAASLQARGATGERVLLLFSPGLDYVAAIFGCFYAGALAVPAYPPDPFRMDRTFPRLQAICTDAQAKFVLTSEEILNYARGPILKWTNVNTISIESLPTEREPRWRSPLRDSHATALVQYTSGSTGSPRGVMLSHANIMHNLASMHRVDTDGVGGVCWLPTYHDMGLIGGILLAVYSGRRSVLMSPLAFIQRPARWLWAMSKYRGRTSGGPNFAFELCLQKIQPSECEGLDLSSWTAVVSGAEPVRAETIERFVEKFSPYGLRPEAFLPGYGMAESVLVVSSGRRETPPVIRAFAADALLHHRVKIADASAAASGLARRLVGCGQPVPDGEIAVVDPKTRQLLPPGRVGEIWIRSPSVGQGYWNRPDETQAIFHAEIRDEPGKPYLRTGDVGFLHEGELFVTGRLKELILLGGRNYYPHDIEQIVQRAHPALKQDAGAAFGVERNGVEQLVVVHEILRPRRWDVAEVLAAIRRELAEEFEISPTAVVLIRAGTLPKTSSGKTRRVRCRELFLRGQLHTVAAWHSETDLPVVPAKTEIADPPSTDTEKRLARIWTEVLGAEPRRNDNFFALGGHSLPAVRLVVRVNAAWNVELSLSELFQHPTLSDLAAAIDRLRDGSAKSRMSGADVGPPEPLPPDLRRGPQPLSFAQERLWLFEQIAPGASATLVPFALRLEGPLDVEALREAIRAVIARHEILRTRFVQRDGRPWQDVADSGVFSWDEVDLRGLPPAERNVRIEQFASPAWRPQLDLESGKSLHVTLAQTGEFEYTVYFLLHHIVCDGWSLEVLLRDIAAVYEGIRLGRRPCLTALPLQYVDYVHWQRRRISGERLEKGLAYWKDRLNGAPQWLELTSDRPRSTGALPEGAACTRRLSPSLYHSLEALAHTHGCTPFMVFLTAFQILLSRYAGAEDFCVGTPVANRIRPELDSLIGCFVNTVPLRCDLSGDPSFAELLRRNRAAILADLAHAEVPFEKIVESLVPTRVSGRPPLVQTMFVFQPPIADSAMMDGVVIKEVRVDYSGLAVFDLTLIVEPRGTNVAVTLVYNRAWFDPSTADQMLDALVAVLEAVAVDASLRLAAMPIPAARERQRMLLEWNATARPPVPAEGVHRLVEKQAAKAPDAVAIAFQQKTTTYRELEAKSNRLARWLCHMGVSRGDRVGIYLDRSPRMITAMLAVGKAGACYVPLDPALGRERLAFMIADSGMRWVLADASLESEWMAAAAERLPHGGRDARGGMHPDSHGGAQDAARGGIEDDDGGETEGLPRGGMNIIRLDESDEAIRAFPSDPLPSQASSDDLAYLIYTSGSTGTPKAVMIPHRAVVNFVDSFAREPGVSADDVVLAMTTISFDIAVFEIFLPLTVGARIALASREWAADGWRLAEWIRQQGVNVIQATPSTYRLLLATGWRPRPGQRLICGGEALSAKLAAQLASEGVELWNAYGPTETTVWSTLHRVRAVDCREGVVPIGRPIGNTQVYVLDEQRLPVPIGVPGELYIGGQGLADGYWNRAELTAERFVEIADAEWFSGLKTADSASAAARPASADPRLYRTGDRVRWRNEGVLEFLGRLDRQVKIRGFRVELGEVESVLDRHPRVAEAAVIAREDGGDAASLVAYIVPAEEPCSLPPEGAGPTPEADVQLPRRLPELLRAYLAERLPDYMIPSGFILLDAMPRTATGKLDLRRLARCAEGCLASSVEYAAPRSPLEEAIATLWAELLRVERVGIHDNFLELGGHSLLATQMLYRLRELCDAELPLKTLFERPTVAGVAEAIVAASLARQPRHDISRVLDRLEQMSDDEAQSLLESGCVEEVFREIR